jgi:hypothetical protein
MQGISAIEKHFLEFTRLQPGFVTATIYDQTRQRVFVGTKPFWALDVSSQQEERESNYFVFQIFGSACLILAMLLIYAKASPHSFQLDELIGGKFTQVFLTVGQKNYRIEKIIFILREKEDFPKDNGVWVATSQEHHESLKKDFPSLRKITIFGENGGWRILPADARDFEEAVNFACEKVIEGDLRIGKVPKARKPKKKKPT